MKILIKLQKEDQIFEMVYQLNLKKNKTKIEARIEPNKTTNVFKS